MVEGLVCGAQGGAPAAAAEATVALWGTATEIKVVFEAVRECDARDELDDVRVQVPCKGAVDADGSGEGGGSEVLPAGALLVAEAGVAGNDRKDEEWFVLLLDQCENLPLCVHRRTPHRGLRGGFRGAHLPHAVPLPLDFVAHRSFFGGFEKSRFIDFL